LGFIDHVSQTSVCETDVWRSSPVSAIRGRPIASSRFAARPNLPGKGWRADSSRQAYHRQVGRRTGRARGAVPRPATQTERMRSQWGRNHMTAAGLGAVQGRTTALMLRHRLQCVGWQPPSHQAYRGLAGASRIPGCARMAHNQCQSQHISLMWVAMVPRGCSDKIGGAKSSARAQSWSTDARGSSFIVNRVVASTWRIAFSTSVCSGPRAEMPNRHLPATAHPEWWRQLPCPVHTTRRNPTISLPGSGGRLPRFTAVLLAPESGCSSLR
jgi:hypothetical protein